MSTRSVNSYIYCIGIYDQNLNSCCFRPRKREMTCTASLSRPYMRCSKRVASRICCWRRSCRLWPTRWRRKKLSSMKFCLPPTLTPRPSPLSPGNWRWDCGPLVEFSCCDFSRDAFVSFFVFHQNKFHLFARDFVYLLLFVYFFCCLYIATASKLKARGRVP